MQVHILYKVFIHQVFFRAGVLGTLEEIRDDRLGKIITLLQASVRGFASRKRYTKLQEQRQALLVIQHSLRRFMSMRNWSWNRLWQKVRPLLNVTRIEDEMRALEKRAMEALDELDKEKKRRVELEMTNTALLHENS